MSVASAEFRALISAVLARFFAQNHRPAPSAAELAPFADRLWQLMQERGLVRASDGELTDDDTRARVARVLAGATDDLLATAARQLVKTCLQPSPATCRNSYREVTADGRCRRQELARVQTRTSGSHCVDCPYWLELDADDHAALLAQHWQSPDTSEFIGHRALFLPEDYRTLRRFALARR